MSSGASPVRTSRPRRAISPSSAAVSAFRAPPYRPIGVRTGSQITTSRMMGPFWGWPSGPRGPLAAAPADQGAADDQPLDLARSLIQAQQADVAVDPLDRDLPHVPGTAVYLHGQVGHPARHLGAE